jgi:hypothetical protein
MIGRPRRGDMLVRSASAETIRNAPTAAARSRIRLSAQSGQSPTVCGGLVMPPPDASAISANARRATEFHLRNAAAWASSSVGGGPGSLRLTLFRDGAARLVPTALSGRPACWLTAGERGAFTALR